MDYEKFPVSDESLSISCNKKKFGLLCKLPGNKYSPLYVAIFLSLHIYGLCLLGFCQEQDYKRHHQHDISPGSIIFFSSVAVAVSQYSWWPCTLGPPPKSIPGLLYKVWVATVAYNFTERLMWYGLYEGTSLFLEYNGKTIALVQSLITGEEVEIEIFTSDTLHQVALTFVALFISFKIFNSKGLGNDLLMKLKKRKKAGKKTTPCKRTSSAKSLAVKSENSFDLEISDTED